ncbi:MAG TPA: LuxR C-terminal-related transcriptional regulator [Dehalococcoidia bacterium]|nr:LuxR C-terminal-related transcriptional regulator [Dehalococcoidia bacterium]
MEAGLDASLATGLPYEDELWPPDTGSSLITTVFNVLSHAPHPGCVITPAFCSVLDHDSVAVIVVDGTGGFIYCNASAEALLGYDAATLTSRTIFEVVDADSAWITSEFGHLAQHDIWSGRVRLRQLDGGFVRVAVNAFANRAQDSTSEYVAMLHAAAPDEPAIVRLEAQAGVSGLTARHISVLQLLAEGFADKEVASILNTSVWTINKDVGTVLHELNASSRTEACIKAVRRQLIT